MVRRQMHQQGMWLGLLLVTAHVLLPCQTAAAAHAAASFSSSQVAGDEQQQQQEQLSRYVVSYTHEHKLQLQQQLQERGYRVVSEGPGFFTVTHPTAPQEAGSVGHRRQLIEGPAAAAAAAAEEEAQAHKQHTQLLSGLPGVHSSEQDVRRHLHMRPSLIQPGQPLVGRKLTAAESTHALSKLLGHWHMGQRPHTKGYDQWGAEVVDAACAARDVPQNPEVANSEIVPWGVKEVGAWNAELQKLPQQGRSIVCIIDSGLWGGHPEWSNTAVPGRQDNPHNTFDGCHDRSNCPFEWNSDIVGHGSHVAGTISAPENGIGVVGVMSQGAEVFVVRVWNNNGDVSQGQGPYATDLVLAYNHCLEHLKAEQAKEGSSGKKVSMVINMSFGSAGPLTVERIWIERAAQRGDLLFVGSAGNNGSFLDVGKRVAGPASLAGREPVGQYLSYPASYRLNEMLSVANARCDGSIEFTSQKNKQVSIAAPGMAILSSVPREHGIVRGHISTTAKVTAPGKMKGVGFLPNGFLEPRPIQGSALSSTQSLPLVSCSIKDDQQRLRLFGKKQEVAASTCAGAKDALCFIELPGKGHLFEEVCAAMAKCVRSGGAGLVAWQHQKPADVDAFYSIPASQLDCGPTCKCWTDLKASLGCQDLDSCSSKAPPGILISPKHAASLAAAGAGKGDAVKARVTNFEYNYKYFDGTSMAAPHVTGAAALLWRLVPNCKAADIAQALKMSAQRLPGQQQVPDYASGHGMLKVDKAYAWIQQNNACATS